MNVLITLAVPLATLLHAASANNCTHNGFDFSSLINNEVDYYANDHVFDGHYEYVWNVCRPLVWAEGVCEEGKTAMCERIKDSRTVTGLYGESNQITWGLDDTERYVTEPDQPVAGVTYFETLAGDCAFGGADTVRSRVYFTCDREAIDKVEVAVIYESYYSCTVFVEMKTALACSDIVPTKHHGSGKGGQTFGIVFAVLVAVGAIGFFAKLRVNAYRSGETGSFRKVATVDSNASEGHTRDNVGHRMEAGTSSYADTSLDEGNDDGALDMTAPMSASSPSRDAKRSSYGSDSGASPARFESKWDDGRAGETKGLLSAAM